MVASHGNEPISQSSALSLFASVPPPPPTHTQKCGTTSLAAHLKRHPALSGISGMPGHEALAKESHFFMGLLGRGTTGSAVLYRSFFPTVLTRWVGWGRVGGWVGCGGVGG